MEKEKLHEPVRHIITLIMPRGEPWLELVDASLTFSP